MPGTHFARPEHAYPYGKARALPADTLRQWMELIGSLVPGAEVP